MVLHCLGKAVIPVQFWVGAPIGEFKNLKRDVYSYGKLKT